jgi:hypothetical protein
VNFSQNHHVPADGELCSAFLHPLPFVEEFLHICLQSFFNCFHKLYAASSRVIYDYSVLERDTTIRGHCSSVSSSRTSYRDTRFLETQFLVAPHKIATDSVTFHALVRIFIGQTRM